MRRIQISDAKRSHTQSSQIRTAVMPMNWSQYALFYINNPNIIAKIAVVQYYLQHYLFSTCILNGCSGQPRDDRRLIRQYREEQKNNPGHIESSD